MGAFSDLLDEAERLGALEATFVVKLNVPKTPDGHRPWSCRALLSSRVPNLAQGRTGEEALRELVRFLEMTQ